MKFAIVRFSFVFAQYVFDRSTVGPILMFFIDVFGVAVIIVKFARMFVAAPIRFAHTQSFRFKAFKRRLRTIFPLL